MAYQIYITDYTEGNQAMVLALLRLKEEAGKLEPEEGPLLARLKSSAIDAFPEGPQRVPPRQRRIANGRSDSQNGAAGQPRTPEGL